MKNAVKKRIENQFKLYELEIFNFQYLSGNYKSSFETYIYFDYSYSNLKGRVLKQICVKKNETYAQAIQRTIDLIENQ